METRVCKKCGIEKGVDCFYQDGRNPALYRPRCKDCMSEDARERRSRLDSEERRAEACLKSQKFREENPEKVQASRKAYYEEHKEEEKQYQRDHYEENRPRGREWARANDKRKTDPVAKLRNTVSNLVRLQLKSNGSSKAGKSITQHLGYSSKELKAHLEAQFESWMTWDNYGRYHAKTWNDNDPATWTWQLDHITPQSDFHFESMESEAFKECWALENLRPLSAKQNQIDGVNRERHETPRKKRRREGGDQ